MAIVSRAALLLLLVMVAGAAAKATLDEATTEAGNKDEESWTDWAKDKISEGIELKHHDEEEAARESAQHTTYGEKLATFFFLPCNFTVVAASYAGTDMNMDMLQR
jgi:hypothetical protein